MGMREMQQSPMVFNMFGASARLTAGGALWCRPRASGVAIKRFEGFPNREMHLPAYAHVARRPRAMLAIEYTNFVTINCSKVHRELVRVSEFAEMPHPHLPVRTSCPPLLRRREYMLFG